MSSLARVSKMNLLAAIRDYPKDSVALSELYEDWGLDSESADLMIVDRGKQFDARLITLAAYQKVSGERWTEADLPADLARVLTRLELKVTSLREVLATERLKANRGRVPGTPRAAGAPAIPSAPVVPLVPAPPVCERCFMQLPAGSKACNYCD